MCTVADNAAGTIFCGLYIPSGRQALLLLLLLLRPVVLQELLGRFHRVALLHPLLLLGTGYQSQRAAAPAVAAAPGAACGSTICHPSSTLLQHCHTNRLWCHL
jgi:hypothetical protein